MATQTSIDLQAGRYHGGDLEACKAFGEVQTNWTRLKNTLVSGGLPSLMAKITSGYSSGYDWVEVYEAAAGTFAVLSGGRASGSGGWPKAFETNGGTANHTNAYAELRPSTDVTSGVTTVSFDAKAVRVAGNDLLAIPSGPSFSAGTLTIPYTTFYFDLFGRSVGSTTANYTVALTAGAGVDLENNTSVAKSGASFINLPTTNGTTTVLEFVSNGGGGDLRLKTGAQYKTLVLDGSGNWTIDYVRFH